MAVGRVFLWLFLLSNFCVAEEVRHEIGALQTQRLDLVHAQKRLLEEVAALEKTLQGLTVKIAKQKTDLRERQTTIARQLPLLIRLARTNTLRLLIDPLISTHTLRSVILVRALTTSVKRQVADLQADIQNTTSLSKDLEEKTQKRLHILHTVEAQQKQLSSLKDKKLQEWQSVEKERLAGENDSNVLLAESQAALSQDKKNVQTAALAKGLPFSRLEQPVMGTIIIDLTLQKKFSPGGRGIIFKTSKNADVFAPAKGTVVFKGPFRSQDEILILDHGQNVHTVFMGMHKMSAEIGQTVYAGDILGIMAGYGKDDPLLYVELRQNGKAIDPQPYFIH